MTFLQEGCRQALHQVNSLNHRHEHARLAHILNETAQPRCNHSRGMSAMRFSRDSSSLCRRYKATKSYPENQADNPRHTFSVCITQQVFREDLKSVDGKPLSTGSNRGSVTWYSMDRSCGTHRAGPRLDSFAGRKATWTQKNPAAGTQPGILNENAGQTY